MLLKIVDPVDKTITIVKVMMLELEENSNQMKIWDYCDNVATLTAKAESDLEYCARNLYSSNRAEITATVDWETE